MKIGPDVFVHEAGHAVASLALGRPFDRVDMAGPAGPGVYPRPGFVSVDPDQEVVSGCAGLIAAAQDRARRFPDESVFDLLEGRRAATTSLSGQVVSHVPAGINGPGQCLNYFATLIASCQMRREDVLGIWRGCEQVTKALRPAIVAVAEALTARQVLGDADVMAIAGPHLIRQRPAIEKALARLG